MSTLLATGVLVTAAGLRTEPARALDYVDANDCFPTPAAVMAAHPDAAHVSWAKGTNPRCFFADRFRAGARETAVQQQQAVQQPAAPAQQPKTQQFGIFGIPLGIPEQQQPAAEQPAAQPPQQAVQEPVSRPLRRHAARPQPRQPAIAVAPAPRTTTAAAVAPAPRPVAVPQTDETPAPQAAVEVPALPRVTATPLAAQNAAIKDAPDDAAADFESRFSASGYRR